MPAIDGLRGVAVAGVLLFHGGHLVGGYLGVDLFFVLSGFLITSLLLVEWSSSGTIALGAFWARRARRLLPALVLLLAGIALYAAVFADGTELAQIRADALATLGYVANWHTILDGGDYWTLFAHPSPLAHSWSLAIEEQFYLVWPLVVLGVLHITRSTHAVLATAGALVLASAAWSRFGLYPDGDVNRIYFGTDTRAAGIFLGAVLAALLVTRGPARSRIGRIALEAAGIVGVVALGVAWTQVGGSADGLYRGGLVLCGVAALAVIAAAAHPAPGPIARVLAWSPLRWLGLVSYGLYLWHWPVYLVLSRSRTGLTDPILLAVRVGVSLVLAVVSYLVVELPIRRGALSARWLWALTPAAATALVVAVVATTAGPTVPTVVAGITVPATARAQTPAPPSEAPGEPGAATGLAPPTPPSTGSGGTQWVPDVAPVTNFCRDRRTGDFRAAPPSPPERSAAPRVMIVGDSVACFLGASFEQRQDALGIAALNRAVAACPIARADEGRIRNPDGSTSEQHPPCRDFWDADLASWQPDIVVMVLASPGFYDFRLDGEWRAPCDPEFDSWYGAHLAAALDELSAHGATVVVATVLHPEPVEFVELPPELGVRVDCLNAVLRAVVPTHPAADLVDLDAWVCPEGRCRTELEGIDLRPDGVHFVHQAADLVTRWLTPRILAAAGVSVF